MKRRSLQLAAIGLSTIVLWSTVSISVRAEAPEDSEGLIAAPEDNVEDDSNNNLESEDENEDEQSSLEDLVDTAAESSETAVDASEDAIDVNENALTVLQEQELTADEAYDLMGGAEDSILDAEEAFETAQEDYDAASKAYDAAVQEYNKVLEEYESSLKSAEGDLATAQGELDKAAAEVERLKAQLDACTQELVDAGATGLVAAEGEAEPVDIDAYIGAVVQHLYVPQSESLNDGDTIQNYSVTVPKGVDGAAQDYVIVTYDVCGPNGEVLRTGYGEYTYSVDAETGKITLSTRTLTYEYENKDSEIVSITKDEADQLNGQIAIDAGWTASGDYVPRFEATGTYTVGYPRNKGYDYNKDIVDGESGLKEKAVTDYPFENVDVSYVNMEYQSNGLKYNYNVYYDVIGKTWTVSDGISNTYYESEDEAYAAVLVEAQSKGAYTIDKENSTGLKISYNTTYADIVSKYVDTNSDDVSAKIQAYNDLIRQYDSAKTTYSEAVEKVAQATEQVANIKNSQLDIAYESAKLTVLSEKLDTAKSNCDKAEENINSAWNYFFDAYDIYNEKYMMIGGGRPPVTPVEPEEPETPVEPEEPTQPEEPVEPQEPTEEPKDTPVEEPEEEPVQEPTETPVVDTPSENHSETTIPQPSTEKDVEDVVENEDMEQEDEKKTTEDVDVVVRKSSSGSEYLYTMIVTELPEDEEEILETEEEVEEELEEEHLEEEITNTVGGGNSSNGGDSEEPTIKTEPDEISEDGVPELDGILIEEEEAPKGITIAGIMARGKWFVALGGVSVAGIGVGAFEAKRRAAMKLLDKLNQ